MFDKSRRYSETLKTTEGGAMGRHQTQRSVTSGQALAETAGREFSHPWRKAVLAELVDDVQDGSATVTAIGTVIYANRRLAHILGLPMEEVQGAQITSFIAHDDLSMFETLLNPAPGESAVKVHLLAGNRGKVPVIVGAAPLEVRGEVLTCMTFTDLTAQAAVDRNLRNDAARTVGILNSAKQALVGMDRAGRITEWNRQAEITFGWTRADAVGRDLAETILAVEFRAGLTWFLPGGKGIVNRRFESRAVDRDGREFPIELALWEVDSGESVASYLALAHDISERRTAEEAMRLAFSCALAAVAQMPRQSVPPRGRVLVVDDYPMNQLVATAIVEQLGYQVDAANNGAEALTAVQWTRYDVILMDCLMPVMDGYQATRRIRDLEGPCRHTPIVALTALSMTGDREKCLAAGMNDYISKPFVPAALSDALARCRPD